MIDLIDRQEAIDTVNNAYDRETWESMILRSIAIRAINKVPSMQIEPLTDKEQRIFLAAMAREENVCKEVDAEMTREPYENSLASICREIKRKVKKSLWTN